RRRDVGVRTALVLLHAVSGIVGLVAGLLALPPPGARRRGWRMLYAACVAVLVAGIGGSAQLSHCRPVSAVAIPGGSATIGPGDTSGCGAAWQRASFGTKRPWVQIPPPRPGEIAAQGPSSEGSSASSGDPSSAGGSEKASRAPSTRGSRSLVECVYRLRVVEQTRRTVPLPAFDLGEGLSRTRPETSSATRSTRTVTACRTTASQHNPAHSPPRSPVPPVEWLRTYAEPEPVPIEFLDSAGGRWLRDEPGTLTHADR